MLDAISMGVSIASGISGFFGSRRERRAKRRKQRAAKRLMGQQFEALQGAMGAERADFAQQRAFMGEAQQLGQASAIQQQRMGMQQLQSQVGRTGLAGSGSGIQALDAGREQFLQQQEARDLQNRESAFQLQQREASSIRDIQSAGFQLDQYGADMGLKSNYGQSLLSMYGGY